MKWFNGSVEEAVTAANQSNSYFLVYVQGHDEPSETMTSVINSNDISDRLESNNWVCVQVQSDTEEYNQFVNLYKHVPVPSLFLIGLNGVPVSVVNNVSGKDKEILRQQILTVLSQKDNKALKVDKSPGSRNRQKLQAIRDKNDTLFSELTSETSEITDRESEDLSFEKDSLFSSSSLGTELEQGENNTTESQNKKEGGDPKNSENQTQRENNEDLRLQEILQERIRNEKDRQRILNDIAIDKQERQSRQQDADNHPTVSPNTLPRGSNSGVPAVNINQTCIQFRKPDGSTFNEIFNTQNLLNDLRLYVVRTMQINTKQFKLGTPFPRHIFTEEESNRSLEELNLVPNAVIIIILSNENDAPATYFFAHISSTLWYVVSPITSLYRFIRNAVFGITQPQITDGILRRPPIEATTHQTISPRQPKSPNQLKPGQGKVHTMANINNNKDKDKNSVWNGNSTQQSQ